MLHKKKSSINAASMLHNSQLCVGGIKSPHKTAGNKSTLPSLQKQQSNIFDDDLRVMHKNLRFVFDEKDTKTQSKKKKKMTSFFKHLASFFVCLLCWHWVSHMRSRRGARNSHIFGCFGFISTFTIPQVFTPLPSWETH
jgi:hypothetical protein